jgi:hypothetical protein
MNLYVVFLSLFSMIFSISLLEGVNVKPVMCSTTTPLCGGDDGVADYADCPQHCTDPAR